MKDSDVEGWSGYRVDQIDTRARVVVPLLKPNVVLINAGTNDATQNFHVATTGDRMRSMINFIFDTSPGVCVFLSTLLPNTINPTNVASINTQYRALVQEFANNGKKIVLVEFDDGWMTTADVPDGTHPHDAGYRKMAAKWAQAIRKAEADGLLSAPSHDVSFSDAVGGTTTCDKVFGSGNQDARGRTQVLKALSPRIIDDGPYVHSAQYMGAIHSGWYAGNDTVWFAGILSHGVDRSNQRDDWVFSQGAQAIYYRENLGDGTWGAKTHIPSLGNIPCHQKRIRWGDVNNDGLDDFICLGDQGNMYVAINDGGTPPVFRDIGLYKKAPMGYTHNNVRLGDIDGDGRLDYCVVAGSGNIYCWRNGGWGEKAGWWQDLGNGKPVFTGKGMGNIDGVQLVDLNGDFRSDWLWLSDIGQVTTYMNKRNAGKGMIPYWESRGVTHAGMGEAGARSQIRFGRVYGTGRADYIYIKCITLVDGRCDYEVRAWKNVGSGGKHQKGDGVRWCDMTGSGNDDYVFIDHNSKITIFRNINTPPNTDYSSWVDKGVVLDLGGTNRKDIHLGDWNGDGFCDIIVTNKNTGAVDVYYTYWDEASDTFVFSAKTAMVGSGCTQGWGVGPFDLGMRFHDIDGDGRVDYLCLEKDGRTTGWLNKVTGLQWANQIKFSVEKDRANHRWADVNGDGRLDFLWLDKFNGDTSVWYNMGERDISGSSFWWDPKGKKYQGSTSGPNLHFPNLGGQGRADMTEVNPQTGQGWTWFNSCPPGGDDGEIVDPVLPLPPSGGYPPPDGGHGGNIGFPPGNPGSGPPPPDDGTSWGGGSGGSGIWYIDDNVWSQNTPTIGCLAPCTYNFPPSPLASPVTVTWPQYETGIWVSSDSTYKTTSTIISIPPFVITELPYWPITVKTDDPKSIIVYPVPSVQPPLTVVTLRSDQATMSIYPVTGPDNRVTYRPVSPTSWGGTATIQPQPTVPLPPVITPPPTPKPIKHEGDKTTGGSDTCTAKCSKRERNCFLFGCGGGCGLLGCKGGCGLTGCGGGGCGILGCGGNDWNNNNCGPAGCGCKFGCANGGGGGMGGGPCNGPECDNSPEPCEGDDCDCESTKAVPSCSVLCTETKKHTWTKTGDCSTITCTTTTCGTETTRTRTTVTTEVAEVTLTVMADDQDHSIDPDAAHAVAIRSSVTAWLNDEDSFAATACTEAPVSWPTHDTMGWTGPATCFGPDTAPPCEDYDHVDFSILHMAAAANLFCNTVEYIPALFVGISVTFIVDDRYSVFAGISWAEDQSGCGTKSTIYFDQDQWAGQCEMAWDRAFFACHLPDNLSRSYGGSYVLKHPLDGKGCLRLTMWGQRRIGIDVDRSPDKQLEKELDLVTMPDPKADLNEYVHLDIVRSHQFNTQA
ncbi:hypothetical protein VTJ49DRAFT_6345 [Mycothermus thermophilus]|uniref:SGNH hydrolase-type esterase domain-containing protein n=1 Tax=Humicola insolens TaxID=85995 RepID=A0ABR3V291_HUMIN